MPEQLPAAPGPQRARVPAMPPDSFSSVYYQEPNLIGRPVCSKVSFIRHIVGVWFKEGTTQAHRQAAIDSVGGTVVGGIAISENGMYIIHVDDDETGAGVCGATGILQSLPQVDLATPDYRAGQDRRRPRDASGRETRDGEVHPNSARGQDWAPHTRDTLQRPPVPLIPPDTLPSRAVRDSIYAKENALWTDPRFPEGTPRNIIFLWFHNHATQQDRQQAVDLIQGEVIGAIRIGTDGLYIIRIPSDGTAEPLARALEQLQALPQVRLATEHPLGTGPASGSQEKVIRGG